MSVVNLWVGAVDHESARVIAKASPGAASVELLVSTNVDVSSPLTFGPEVPDVEDVVSFIATGLAAGTRYFYALDEDGTFDPDVDPIGTFRTHPAEPGNAFSFTFAAGGCAGSGPPAFPGDGTELDPGSVSNHPVFAEIRDQAVTDDWLFFMHTGDMHYYNLGVDNPATLANYRTALDDVLHQSSQQALYRDVPLVYVWDDHDYGPNNSDGTFADKLLPQQVYRERVPSYPLQVDGSNLNNNPIYHSFTVGRVLFIVSDARSSRSPDSDPDGPDKTMLGANQKTWMAGVLATSDAEMLVWLSPQAWLANAGAWPGYGSEVTELVNIFTATGWIDRMMVISGDSHYLAMDDGTNTPGSTPLFVANHLDSNPSSSSVPFSEGPVISGKGHYGTVSITDDGGAVIEVTWQGWASGGSLVRSFIFTIGEEPEPPEPPEPELPTVAVAEIRTEVTWLGCDLVSGQIIAELPDITGQVSRVLGAYTSANLTIPIPLGGPAHIPLATVLQAIDPARTMVVAVVNDIPTWAGIALLDAGGTDATLSDGLVSLEGYLRHRFVRDHVWTQQDEASVIAAGLIGDAEASINGLGAGIGLIIDAPPTGTLRDRTYLASDHKSVYDALTELMAVQDGPEWTIDLDWTDTTHTAIAKIARVRKRIGIAASPPTAMFQTTADSLFSAAGSSEARYVYSRDRTDGRYANAVQAYSSGEGEDQPNSVFAVDVDALAAGAPIWELHYQPSSSITTQSVLDDHAAAKLALLRDGTNTWKITARWDAYPRYGVDWQLGDDIAWDLIGHRHPDGVVGQGRAIGFELDMQAGVIIPILQEEAS